jgi:nucleotide-binding universal stress UspA family protein
VEKKKRNMKRILVGFDGSEGSENALNKAMMLIDENGELILLAVIPLPSDKNLLDEKTYQLMKTKAQNLIDTVLRDIGSHAFTITGIVEEGDIAAKIIDIASNLNCDLIVLGSKGSSELGRYPIGSIANKVVQYAHKPVMVVR